ncbi:MAG: lamin tail domain-containing protein [Kiritimatiellae bacterium]|nr:lamin tail domain-containing protein [Kiritimatiellia bacterium]
MSMTLKRLSSLAVGLFSAWSVWAVNGFYLEFYSDLPAGYGVSLLTSSSVFPDSPTWETIIEGPFEADENIGDQYGQRARAILTPLVSGDYVFYLATDNGGELWFGADGTPTTRSLIASVSTYAAKGNWTKEASQKSATISLAAGRRYYLEVLMKEDDGGDNLVVAWTTPGSSAITVIPQSYIEPYLEPPVISGQPASVSIDRQWAGTQTVTFTVTLNRKTGVTYHWLEDGVELPGETEASYTLIADAERAGHLFTCRVTNLGGTVTSNPATYQLVDDTTAPTLVSWRQDAGAKQLTLNFSEPLSATAFEASNYAFTPAAEVASAVSAYGGKSVVLTFAESLQLGTTYRLNAVLTDCAEPPNSLTLTDYRMAIAAPPVLPARLVRGGVETAGPSSRRSPIAITEIHAAPAARTDGKDVRFIELYNSNPYPERLGGFTLSGSIAYTFPAGYRLEGQSYLVIAASPADIRSVYGISNVVAADDASAFTLPGEVTLKDEIGAWISTIAFADADDWPGGINGTGHSLVLARPSYGERVPEGWARSASLGGSPGTADPTRPTAYAQLLINEILPHGTGDGFVEVVNLSGSSVNLGGCRLACTGKEALYAFPAGTTLAAHGVLGVTESDLGFTLNGAGMEALLLAPENAGGYVIDALRVPPTETGTAYGRAPDGGNLTGRLETPTPGHRNAAFKRSEVVLNELMYHPITDTKDDEYIELLNTSDQPVDLKDWTLSGGITYTFTETIPAGGYLVVPRSKKRFKALYPEAIDAMAADSYDGGLSNERDTVLLSRPLPVTDADTGTVAERLVPVERVTYCDGGAWGEWADGGGSSLERIDPRGDARLAGNWAASDETAKSGWTTVSYTGTIEYGRASNRYGDPNEIQIGLLTAGECLIDSVVLKRENGSNLVLNPSFEEGNSSWRFYGSHEDSAIETDPNADDGGKVLHLRAVERVQTSGNGVRGYLSSSLPTSGRGTISARVRWLAGCPELFMRARGNWIEAFGDITTTRAFGTPGRANSRAGNAPPVIINVTHEPLLPRNGESVSVYAQIADPDGLRQVTLSYHQDGVSTVSRVAMTACEGGWFKGVIPLGQASNALMAFTVTAEDSTEQSLSARYPAKESRECLVRYNEPTNIYAFGSYRMWITAANLNRWGARNQDSNAPVDATFLYGNDRVVYGAGVQYGGSPFHNKNFSLPINNGYIDYKFDFPGDDRILDSTHIVLATTGNSGNDPAGVKEQYCYALVRKLGFPNMYRRFVHFYANGTLQNGQRIIEDTEKPGSPVLAHWYPDHDDGNLLKADDWFEYPNEAFRDFSYDEKGATLESFKTTDDTGESSYKLMRYRWNWMIRAGKNYEQNNYTNFYALVDAMNLTGSAFEERIGQVVNIPSFVGIAAVNQFIGNYDAYGKERGKNMYIYNGLSGWEMVAWDMDINFGGAGVRDTNMTDHMDPMNSAYKCIDPIFLKFLRTPSVTREYWRAVIKLEAAARSGSDELVEAQARNTALRADNTTIGSISGFLTNVERRRATVAGHIAAADVASFQVQTPAQSPASVDVNVVTVTGLAPFAVTTITADNVPLTVTWTTPTTWTARVVLRAAEQTVTFAALDETGSLIGSVDRTFVVNGGILDDPDNCLKITEIMASPSAEGGQYVEILNTSSNTLVELRGYFLSGAVTGRLPDGYLLDPRQAIVLVADGAVFSALYGSGISVAGTFTGTLPAAGTLLLCRAARGMELTDPIVDSVTYGGMGWPETAAGCPLLRVDPDAPGCQPANWRIAETNTFAVGTRMVLPLNTSWSYYATGYPGDGWKSDSFNFSAWPAGAGPLGHDTDATGWANPIQTDFALTSGRVAYYFKTGFYYVNPANVDGGVIYPTAPSPELIANNYLVHRWSFNGTPEDSVGGSTATLNGTASRCYFINNTGVYCVGGNKGRSWVTLGTDILPTDGTPVTIEVWGQMCSVKTWSRVFDIGSGTTDYLTVGNMNNTTTGFFSVLTANYSDFGSFIIGSDYHLALVIVPDAGGSTITCYLQDAATGQTRGRQTVYASGWTPASLNQVNCWLGHSQYNDQDANAIFDECRIWNVALSETQLTHNAWLGPDQLPDLAAQGAARESFTLSYLVDDSVVVYLNGEEVHRSELMPEGEITDSTPALNYVPQAQEGTFFGPYAISTSALRTGYNVLSAEVHQNAGTSSDLAWGMELSASNFISSAASPGFENGLTSETVIPPVVFNEIAQSGEVTWFEFHNPGPDTVSLAGWRIAQADDDPGWCFPAGAEVPGGGFLTVWADGMNTVDADGTLHAGFILPGSSGSVLLYAPDGEEGWLCADRLDYSGVTATFAYGCYPDGDPARRMALYPSTPSAANRVDRPTRRIVINEFMAQNGLFVNPLTGMMDDWFELYNAGLETVDLSGWVVTDTLKSENPDVPNTKSSKALTIPAGVSLVPGEAIRIWTGADGAETLPFDRDNLQAPFGLNKTTDKICLFDAELNPVDRIDYDTLQDPAISSGRWPNGTGGWIAFAVPTPGAPNHPSRFTRHLLAGGPVVIPERERYCATNAFAEAVAGAVLTLLPADADALPEGLAFDGASGECVWTPSEAQGPGVYDCLLCGVKDGVCIDAVPLTFTVLETLNPILFNAVFDQSVSEGDTVTFTVTATREEEIPPRDVPFRFRMVCDPAMSNAVLNAETGVFQWKTGEVDGPGVYSVTLIAEDAQESAVSASTNLTVTVKEVNQPFTYVSPTSFYLWLDEPFEVALQFDDPDLPPNTFSFVTLSAPDGMTLDRDTGVVRWTPTGGQAGTHKLRFRAFDNAGSAKTIEISFIVDTAALTLDAGTAIDATHLRLAWKGKAGLTYIVEWCDDLTVQNWQPFPEMVLPGQAAMTCELDLTLLPAPRTKAFFRVRQTR